jgi:hypothetical protein
LGYSPVTQTAIFLLEEDALKLFTELATDSVKNTRAHFILDGAHWLNKFRDAPPHPANDLDPEHPYYVCLSALLELYQWRSTNPQPLCSVVIEGMLDDEDGLRAADTAFHSQIQPFFRALPYMGFNVYGCAEGAFPSVCLELISQSEGQVTIITPQQHLLGCVNDVCTILHLEEHPTLITQDTFKAKFGFPPHLFWHYLALVGARASSPILDRAQARGLLAAHPDLFEHYEAWKAKGTYPLNLEEVFEVMAPKIQHNLDLEVPKSSFHTQHFTHAKSAPLSELHGVVGEYIDDATQYFE